jgi:hypothetical protein
MHKITLQRLINCIIEALLEPSLPIWAKFEKTFKPGFLPFPRNLSSTTPTLPPAGCKIFVEQYLSFGEVEVLGQLLPLLADHVLVPLESLLQLQQLVWGEGRPDSLRLPEGKEELGKVGTWKKEE